MAKYGSGLSTKDVCELEVEEATEIMDKYKVSSEDKQTIIDMIKEAYFQLAKSYQFFKDFTGEK